MTGKKQAVKSLNKLKQKKTPIRPEFGFNRGNLKKNIDEWNSFDFTKLIDKLFYRKYTYQNAIFNPSVYPPGVAWKKVKSIINKFNALGYTKSELKSYIIWIYNVKTNDVDFPIILENMLSASFLNEWIWNKRGKPKTANGNINKKKRKPKREKL